MSMSAPPTSTEAVETVEHGAATRGRVLIGATVGMLGGFTTLYFTTLGQFIEPITGEFGWTRAELSAVLAVALLGSAAAAPLAGRLVQRFGPRPVVAVSALLLAVGFAALSTAPASQGYLALVALLTGVAGVATTVVGYLVVVPRFFDRRLGLALGVAAAGAGLGGAGVSLLIGATVADLGWRPAYLVLAALALVSGAVAVAVGFPAGSGRAAASPRGEASASELEGLTVREALRLPSILIMLGCLFLTAAATLGFAVHLVAFIIDRGNSPQVAASVSALGAIGVTAGRFISGVLLDRFRAPLVGAMTFLITAVGFVAPALATSSTAVYGISSVIGGFAVGMESDLLPFLVRRYVGLRSYAPMLGLTFGVYTLGSAVGPVLFGLSFDRLGSYSPALWCGVVAFVVAALGLQALGRYRYPDRRPPGPVESVPAPAPRPATAP